MDHLAAKMWLASQGQRRQAVPAHASCVDPKRGAFHAEQDSLNASVLGADVAVGSAEFDLFVKEVHREITVKAGQNVPPRRVMVPDHLLDPVQAALIERLANTPIGNLVILIHAWAPWYRCHNGATCWKRLAQIGRG